MANDYLDHLRTLPALRRCTRHELGVIASIVDEVELPAGERVASSSREVLVTISPTRVLVIGPQALHTLATLAPELLTSAAPPA
jgi:hypothetical protein